MARTTRKTGKPPSEANTQLATAVDGGLDLLAESVFPGQTPLQGKYRFLALCRQSDAVAAIEMVARWDQLTVKQQEVMSLDALARSAELRLKDVVGAVCAEAHEMGNGIARTLLGLAQPEVVTALIGRAKGEKGTRDTEMFLKTVGLLRDSAGGIHVNASANAEARSAAVVVDEEELPSFETEILQSDKFQRAT